MKVKHYFKKILIKVLNLFSSTLRLKKNHENKKKSHKDKIYPLW